MCRGSNWSIVENSVLLVIWARAIHRHVLTAASETRTCTTEDFNHKLWHWMWSNLLGLFLVLVRLGRIV